MNERATKLTRLGVPGRRAVFEKPPSAPLVLSSRHPLLRIASARQELVR
jgi:hypothetical protein